MKKIFTNNHLQILLILLFIFSFKNIYSQIGITFYLANGQVTGTAPNQFFEFDVMAQATANSQFKLAQIYIDYNTTGFGSSIKTNSKVTVTKGTLLSNVIGTTDFGIYNLLINDNTPSKLSISNTFVDSDELGGDPGFDVTNTLGTTAKVYVHLRIAILNTSETSNLSLDATVSQFDQQQYYFSSGDTQTKYSPVNVGSGINSPLPVELTSFSANSVEGTKAQLKWETATEVNNYGFEVERSVVSSETAKVKSENETANIVTENRVWEKVAFVEGHGNSNSPKLYSFTDANLVGGSKFMYRLKQIDIDGTYEYSDAVEVEVLPTKYELFQNYPNPFNPTTNIKFSLPEDAKITINIYNVLGERVGQLLNEDLKAGFHQVEFSSNKIGYQLASGIYLYTIESKNFTQVKKMMLIK
jgi:hypothetical protein